MEQPQRHRDTEDINHTTEHVIACAIEVHRCLGPGLLEPMYQRAMCIELEIRNIAHVKELKLPAFYKGHLLGEYRIDLLVDDLVLVEIKSAERLHPVFEAQLLTYLRLTSKRVGLLLNFNARLMRDGIKRMML